MMQIVGQTCGVVMLYAMTAPVAYRWGDRLAGWQISRQTNRPGGGAPGEAHGRNERSFVA